ncbi:MAG: prephenate dehydratase [SAR86 cluster bacterium]|jgi:chorismate mutase/prephenate dehydratase|nr:MAG: prephenate dehydratase [SAR86 cluster bacterium]|tara:strand:+ start:709 stop:1797 length:1089 start_codon:yes stop_codon:yes gene_type:complete
MNNKKIKILRSKIDKIDKSLYDLIQKRAKIAVEIGNVKSKIAPNSSFYKPDRESKILRNIISSNKKGLLPDKNIRTIFKNIISGCLSLEEVLKVSYLGPEGTHSEAAVLNQFGSIIKRKPSLSIEDVFSEVLNQEANLGLVPVENSSEGVINSTLNCLADNQPINIIGEVYHDIDHQLASGNNFDLKDAFAIASHPQALGQCSKWIDKNIGSIKRLEMPSSAVAAKYAKENKNILCIVNSLAIDKYKLKLVKKNVQDFADNKTRFLVIGLNSVNKTGKDKTSFLIQTVNNPGALIAILRPFEKRKINLSKIETRPSRGNINSHDFFIDCEGHMNDQKLKLTIKEVKDLGSSVRVLGSYPQYI